MIITWCQDRPASAERKTEVLYPSLVPMLPEASTMSGAEGLVSRGIDLKT